MDVEEYYDDYRKEFLYNIDGLIKGEYIRIETDSKKVINEVTKIMDSI